MASNQSIHLVGGIRTWSSKYWNCEKFNFQLSANAPVLKQKQTFTLEPTDDGKWRIKSWLGKYLSAHELGEVSCKADEAGANETFTFEFLKGLVAIKSVHGKYVSADENNITQKPSLGERELFDIVFSIHPHVVIKSFEGRFVKVEGDEVVCNSNLQFGAGTVLHLEYENNGKYAFRATNGKYFSVGEGGVVSATATSKGENELFWFELYGKKVAIKSSNGNFLTPDGQKGTLKTKGDKLSNREQYDVLPADPQVSFKASSGKYVSVQEANLMCNRNEHGANESFSLEWVKDNVYGVRSTGGKLWSLRDGVIHVDADGIAENEQFAVGYHADGKVSFKNESGGKTYYASAKAVGGVKGAAVSEPSENELFECEILNKPQLTLRAKQLGFVGLVGEKVSAGKTSPDVFTIEYKEGKYLLRAPSGDFVSIGAGDAITVSPRNQSPVFIEFTQGKMAFKTTDGEYLLSDDQGNFIVGPQAAAPPAEALFDF